MTINNRIVTRDVAPDQAILDLIARYQAVAAPIANRPIGRITADLTRTLMRVVRARWATSSPMPSSPPPTARRRARGRGVHELGRRAGRL